jgi:DNA topoisomerase-2
MVKKSSSGKTHDVKSCGKSSDDVKSSGKSKKTKISDENNKTIEQMYQKMSQHEHILARSDSYVGTLKSDSREMWVYEDKTDKIVKQQISYIAGLYKIYDEILVNARDHSVRDKTCKNIKVSINQETGRITVWNDGNGVPIVIHKDEKVYLPHMLFGMLLTSSNYDDDEKKVTGGRNGYGAKLTNIFSTEFEIETVDAKEKKKYYQKFSNNMYTVGEPVITNVSSKTEPYTKFSFIPDFSKFNVKGLTNDTVALMKKRVYDLAICTIGNVNIYLNDKIIEFKSFDDYINMYYDKLPSPLIYQEINDRWKVGFIFDPEPGFTQVSFVNGVWTYKGGTHLNYIIDQIISKLISYIDLKHKGINVKPAFIKENMSIFIDSIIENPSFDSQTKENMTTQIEDYGSKCIISDEFITRIVKETNIIEAVLITAKSKEDIMLKKTDGKKVGSLRGLTKLEDANWAGKRRAKDCRLILTEGDSAKAFAISGLSVIGRDRYGVFPLKGKPVNVRDTAPEKILKNQEISNLKQILGLKQRKVYKKNDLNKLRYGGIIILSDQDVDGSHIKGLIINLFHHYWPSLVKLGYVQSMRTPIIKAFKKTDTKHDNPKIFYTLTEYRNWKKDELNDDLGKWDVKYYKGLGTSDDEEAKECFNTFDKQIMNYVWEIPEGESELSSNEEDDEETKDEDADDDDEGSQGNDADADDDDEENDENDDDKYNAAEELADIKSKSYDAITLAFDSKRADDRKSWVGNYNANNIIEYDVTDVPISDFVNKELIHFSVYDNLRSIPSMADGFKPSHRKVYHGCQKKNIFKKEIKVAQLGAYIAEVTEYHHGEASLYGTIINMAQNYVGSNNVNLLVPKGNFGYRPEGGKDAAHPRYIFTNFNELVPFIARKEDRPIYQYNYEDGTKVEPKAIPQILPMVLVNGAEGIGTGFSTFIPCYNPADIVNNLLHMLEGKAPKEIIPWYRGFKGKIKRLDDNKYSIHGIYEIINENTVRITELPIGQWTNDYKAHIESIMVDDSEMKRKIKEELNSKKYKKKTDTEKKHIEKELTTKYKEKMIVAGYKNNSDNNIVDITIEFNGNHLQKLIKNNTLEKVLKLNKALSTTNMHLYNTENMMTKYEFIQDIFTDFYDFRLNLYNVRKNYMIRALENDINIVKYQVKFIKDVMSGKLIVKNRKQSDVIKDLEKMGYPNLSAKVALDGESDDIEEEIEADENKDTELVVSSDKEKPYRYLMGITIWHQTLEKIKELEDDLAKKELALEEYKAIPIEQLWRRELEEFTVAYNAWLIKCDEKINKSSKSKGPKPKKGKGDKITIKAKRGGKSINSKK